MEQLDRSQSENPEEEKKMRKKGGKIPKNGRSNSLPFFYRKVHK